MSMVGRNQRTTEFVGHVKRDCSERLIGHSAPIGTFGAQNRQPSVAHAQRDCSEWLIGLSAPIGAQTNQPLVVQAPSCRIFRLQFSMLLVFTIWLAAPVPIVAQGDSVQRRGDRSERFVGPSAPNGTQKNQPSVAPRIQKIFVPVSASKIWLREDTQTVTIEEFKRLLRAAEPRPPRPSSATIELAEYSATLDVDANGISGSLSFVVSKISNDAEFLRLDPIGLSVSELSWDDGSAIWGTDRNGHVQMLVDRDEVGMHGRWSLAGRPRIDSIEFKFHVAPAVISKLRLLLPHQYSLHSSVGNVTGPIRSGRRDWSLWELNLGSRTSAHLEIRKTQDQNLRPLAATLYGRESTYVFREADLEFRTNLNIDVLNTERQTIDVLVSGSAVIQSVSYGGDSSLTWELRSDPTDAVKRVRITLPAPISGRGQLVSISATSPVQLGEQLKLPQIQLADGVFVSGQVHLTVESPLLLRDVSGIGIRQTGTVPSDGIETLDFEESMPSSRISINVEYPNPSVVTKCLTEIDTSSQAWLLRSESHWFDRSGLTFAVRCRIAPEWEITDVRAKSETSAENRLSNWHVSESDGGQNIVELEFTDALTADSSHVVEIFGRRPPTRRNKQTRLPIIEPLDCEEADLLSAVIHSNSVKLLLSEEADFNRVSADAFEQEWDDMELSPELLEMPPTDVTFFRSRNRIRSTQLNLQSSTPQLDVVAHTKLQLRREELTEELSIRCQPRFEFVDRVVVYFANSGNNLRWSLKDSEASKIQVRRLPVTRHAQFEVPSTGEIWELRLPVATDETFTILGRGRKPTVSILKPALPFVPQAASFEGDVQIDAARDLAVNVDADANFYSKAPLSAVGDDGDLTHRGMWLYESIPTGLQLQTPHLSVGRREPQSATLRVESRIAANGGRWHSHRARYRADDSQFFGFEFRLPESGELLGVANNGQPLPTIRDNDSYAVVSDSNVLEGEIEVHYRTPASTGFLESRQSIVLPGVTHNILRTHWQLICPDDIRIQRPSGADGFDRVETYPSWMQRFFGPMGRERGRGPFKPFDRNDWIELLGIGNVAAVPAGLIDYKFTYLGMPEQVEIRVYNTSGIRLISWIATLATLVVAFVMRSIQLRYRSQVTALWLCLSLAATILVPAIYAAIPGGCLVAIVVGAVFPRRAFYKSSPIEDASNPSFESTIALHNVTALLLVSLVPAITSAVLAQELVDDKPSSITNATLDPKGSPSLRVWIPVDDPVNPSQVRVVHPSKELLDYLRKRAAEVNQQTNYVITQAHYSVEIGERQLATLHARFDVTVFSAENRTNVLLPLQNVNPHGSSPCTVDGMACDIKPGSDGIGFLIEIPRTRGDDSSQSLADATQQSKREPPAPPIPQLKNPPPAVHTHVIELKLFPNVKSTLGGSQVKVGIPQVCNSSVSIASSQRLRIARLNGLTIDQPIFSAQPIENVPIGRIPLLSFDWSRADTVLPKTEATDISCSSLVLVRPTHLTYQCRVLLHPREGGQFTRVDFAIPNDAILIDVVSENPSVHQLSAAPSGPSTLKIDFDQPQFDEFFIDITFIRRISPEMESSPDIETIVPTNDADERLNLASNVIGIVGATGFEIRPMSIPLESISADTFLESWSDSPSVRRPQFAYKVAGTEKLKFELTPLTSVKRVIAHNQVGRVAENQLEWSSNIEVETTAAAVFQYRLDIDPRLRVESVHVFDDAERLHRFSRVANELILFLKDRGSGIQNIVVNASMPVARGRQTELPHIRLNASTDANTTTSLYCDPTLDVDLIGFESTDPPPNESTDGLSFLATFDTTSESPAVAMRIQPRQTPVQSESVTEIEAQSNGVLSLTTTLMFRDVKPQASIRLVIPSERVAGHQIDTNDFEYETVVTESGDVVVNATPSSREVQNLEIKVKTQIQGTVDGSLQLPMIALTGAEFARQFLVIHPQSLMRVTNATLPKIDQEQLPRWFSPPVNEDDASLQDSAFRLNRNSTVELHLETDSGSRAAQIALVNTRVRVTSRNTQSGQTTFYIIGQLDGPLTVNIPKQLDLGKVYVNDKPQPDVGLRGQQLVLNDASRDMRTVNIQWTQELSAGPFGFVRQIETETPFPAEIHVSRIVVSHDVDEHSMLWTQNVVIPATRNDVALDWLEGLLEFNEAAMRETGDPHAPTWNLVQAEFERRNSELASESRRGNSLGARFDLISRRIEDVSAQVRPSSDFKLDAAALASVPTFVSGRQSQQRSARNPRAAFRWTTWIVDQRLVKLVIAALVLAVGLYVAHRVAKLEPGEWLAKHPATAWLLLGTFWWLCLTPSAAGIALLIVSAFYAMQRRPAALTAD